MTTPDTAGVRIELRGIVKRFGPVQVLHGVDLAFEPGHVFERRLDVGFFIEQFCF